PRSGEAQRQRRRDCLGPSDRRLGRARAHHAALRDAEAPRQEGPCHAVHRRRYGHRDVRPARLKKLRVALTMLALLAAPASHAQSKTFLVTDAGIGRLTAETPYTVKDVSAALGGLPVKTTTIYYRDIAISALEAMRDGKRVLL